VKRRRTKRAPIYEDAPEWAGQPSNKGRPRLALLVLDLGEHECEWQVATAGEVEAVKDPHSEATPLLMAHAALLVLPYWSEN
jgi:hypothetical protein